MMERAGKPADNFESEAVPKRDGAFIGTHHKIELHRFEAALTRSIERMCAHGASHAATGGPRSSDVAAVGYVRTSALLVRLQEIGAENLGVFFRDEDFVLRSKPVVERFLARHLSRQGVGFAGDNRGFEDRPNRIGVARPRNADLYGPTFAVPEAFHQFGIRVRTARRAICRV